MMRKWLVFASLAVFFGMATACSDEKVQTPTSDKNFDDEGDPGHHNDPGTGDGGKFDGAATFDSGTLDANDAANDAAAESGDAQSDAVNDAVSD